MQVVSTLSTYYVVSVSAAVNNMFLIGNITLNNMFVIGSIISVCQSIFSWTCNKMNAPNSNNDNKGILYIRIRYSPPAVTHLNILSASVSASALSRIRYSFTFWSPRMSYNNQYHINNHLYHRRITAIHKRTYTYHTTHLYINMFVDTSNVVGVVGPTANPISEASDTISAARVNIQSRYHRVLPLTTTPLPQL